MMDRRQRSVVSKVAGWFRSVAALAELYWLFEAIQQESNTARPESVSSMSSLMSCSDMRGIESNKAHRIMLRVVRLTNGLPTSRGVTYQENLNE